MRIVECLSEDLSLVQTPQDAPKVTRRLERMAQSEPKIDGLLAHVTRLRQMRERTERLLEIPHRLAVG